MSGISQDFFRKWYNILIMTPDQNRTPEVKKLQKKSFGLQARRALDTVSAGYWGLGGVLPEIQHHTASNTPELVVFLALTALSLFDGYQTSKAISKNETALISSQLHARRDQFLDRV